MNKQEAWRKSVSQLRQYAYVLRWELCTKSQHRVPLCNCVEELNNIMQDMYETTKDAFPIFNEQQDEESHYDTSPLQIRSNAFIRDEKRNVEMTMHEIIYLCERITRCSCVRQDVFSGIIPIDKCLTYALYLPHSHVCRFHKMSKVEIIENL